MRRKIKIIALFIISALLVYAIVFAARMFPIISGFGAKAVCSCVFISGRSADDVIKNELKPIPLILGSYSVDLKDSSASGSVWGFAKRKAIYRKGLGCTLINDTSEQSVRAEHPQLAVAPAINQDSIPWPLGNLNADTVAANIDYAQLDRALNYAFEMQGTEIIHGTRAVVVLYNGKILKEKYAPGFNGKIPQTGWSMTKSVTSALIGILVKQGKIAVTDKNLFEAWKNDERKNITLDNLMHANSGLKWREVYTSPSPATNMLYRKDNMAEYAMNFLPEDKPGTHWRYSSGTANMLAYIIRQHTGNDYYRFAYDQLFYKTGMYSAIMEPDATGTFVGSSYCFASARDWARFGLLYLNDGMVNGERILPEHWVNYTTTPSAGATRGEYGAQFWLNAGTPGNPTIRRYPNVPTDCFYADGYEGQAVWIIPSKKLVVVRLSLQQKNNLYENRFLENIIRAIK